MKLILQNCSLSFLMKKALDGNVILPYSYIWEYDGVLIGDGASNRSGITSGNYVWVYDLRGLPVGTKINLSAGKVINMNNWNASQQKNFRHYIVSTTSPNNSIIILPSNITHKDDTVYTMDENNEIHFDAVTITKESENDVNLCVSGYGEPVVTIDVSDVLVSGNEEIAPLETYVDTRIEPDGSMTPRVSNAKVFKFGVDEKCWYFVYTKHNRFYTTTSAFVVFLDENEEVIGTKQSVLAFACNGGAIAVRTPEKTRYILVQGGGAAANNLPGRDVSTILTEAEVV